MEITRVILVDDIAGRRYVKTKEGTVGFIKRRGPAGRFPRRRLERHKAAELNRQLLQIAVAREVETPKSKPTSFNEFWNAARTKFMPLNLVPSRDDPEGIAIFWRKGDPIGTISLKSLDHLIERLAKYRKEWVLWKDKEHKERLDEEV